MNIIFGKDTVDIRPHSIHATREIPIHEIVFCEQPSVYVTVLNRNAIQQALPRGFATGFDRIADTSIVPSREYTNAWLVDDIVQRIPGGNRAVLHRAVAQKSFVVGGPITKQPIGRAYFSALWRITHSCEPNVMIMFDVDGRATVVTLRKISRGEALVCTKCPTSTLLLDTTARRNDLVTRYGINCVCTRCKRPELDVRRAKLLLNGKQSVAEMPVEFGKRMALIDAVNIMLSQNSSNTPSSMIDQFVDILCNANTIGLTTLEMLGASVIIRMLCCVAPLFPSCDRSEKGALWVVDELIDRIDDACEQGLGTLADIRRSARMTRGILRLRVAERRGVKAANEMSRSDPSTSMDAIKQRLMSLSVACDLSDLMTMLPLALDGWLMCTSTALKGSSMSARVVLTTEGGLETILT